MDVLFDACASSLMAQYKKFDGVAASIFTNTRFRYITSFIIKKLQ